MNLRIVRDRSEPMSLRQSRPAWALGAFSAGGVILLLIGCRYSPILPPAASISPQPPAAATVMRNSPPALPSGPGLASNPWRPAVKARDWKHIVLHHTATTLGSVESINAAHLKNKDKNGNPWLGIGYHFVIGNGNGMADGAIEPTFRWRTQIQGAHAGSINKDFNERGIGICLVGDFERTSPTPAQKKSVKLLVKTLRAQYGIPAASVVGHNEIRASSTACPGKNFRVSEVALDEPDVFLGRHLPEDRVEQIAAAEGSHVR